MPTAAVAGSKRRNSAHATGRAKSLALSWTVSKTRPVSPRNAACSAACPTPPKRLRKNLRRSRVPAAA
eukprot:8846864-Lingulodinium_polyedra.AAC.1